MDPFDLIEGEKFDSNTYNNQFTINLAAIQSNLLAFKNKLPEKTRIMVMVKALAYGTSDIQMAKSLKTLEIDILGVSYVDEGVSLRKSSVTQEIFVLNACLYEIPKIIQWDLQIGVSDIEFIQELEKQASLKNKKVKVHLHVNSGMNRFGCLPKNALSLAKFIADSPHLILEGVMTHFAAADDEKQDTFTLNQAQILTDAIDEISAHGIEIPWRHACNSAASMRFSFPQFNMIRIGLSVYGLYPSKHSENALELKLALTLTSRVVGINHCKTGDTISYGRSYTVQDETQKIAVLPIGYFDGLHRNYSGKGYVLIDGKKAPMVGKICMDYMMVDVTHIPNVEIGDQVLIFGEDEYGNYLSPEEFAANGDSIVYELITCLGPRIQRVFTFEESFSLR